VTVVVEGRFIDGLQDQPNAFLDDFVSWRWHPEGATFSLILLGDIHAPDGSRMILLRSQQPNVFLDGVNAEAVQGLPICAWRHVAGLALESLIGHDVKCRVVQESV
jgi:hypothetical protein